MSRAGNVSVVIPTHNRRSRLGRALASVRAQTLAPGEVIVVDDGSTDGTADWLAREHPGVRLLRVEQRRGAAAARNLGVAQARGRLIAFLDSDDAWHPEKLARQLEALASPGEEAVAVFCAIERIRDPDGRSATLRLPTTRPSVRDLCRENVVGTTSSVLARRDALERVGGFDEALPASQDWDLWLRLALSGSLVGIDAPLVRYFDHAGQITRDAAAVYRGRRHFFAKHEALLRSHLSPAEVHDALRTLARLSVLAGDFPEARRLYRATAGSGAPLSQRALAWLVLRFPSLARSAALQRRRFQQWRRRFS